MEDQKIKKTDAGYTGTYPFEANHGWSVMNDRISQQEAMDHIQRNASKCKAYQEYEGKRLANKTFVVVKNHGSYIVAIYNNDNTYQIIKRSIVEKRWLVGSKHPLTILKEAGWEQAGTLFRTLAETWVCDVDPFCESLNGVIESTAALKDGHAVIVKEENGGKRFIAVATDGDENLLMVYREK